jgi:hypothetical protein
VEVGFFLFGPRRRLLFFLGDFGGAELSPVGVEVVAVGVASALAFGVVAVVFVAGEGSVAAPAVTILAAVLAVLPSGVVGPVFFLFLGIVPVRVQINSNTVLQ